MVAKSCMTLCDPWTIACGIFQTRILEWVSISFSRESFSPWAGGKLPKTIKMMLVRQPTANLNMTVRAD